MTRRCKVCGAKYKTCFSCEKNKSWRIHTDTAEHYFIFGVLMDYQSGHDAEKAYAALTKRGISLLDTDDFLPSIQRLIKEILLQANAKENNSSAMQLDDNEQTGSAADMNQDVDIAMGGDISASAELETDDSASASTQNKRKGTNHRQRKDSVETNA